MHDALAFLIGYFMTLLTPGPNMIMIASKAMVDGRRSTMPLNVGLCVGTLALFLTVWALGAAVARTIDLDRVGPLASGAALGFVAYAVAPAHRRRAAAASPRAEDLRTLGVMVGIPTALFNPITASYFASQFLNPTTSLRADAASIGAATLGLLLLCWGRGVVVASVFSASRWRAAALRHETVVRLALCAALAGYAGWTAAPQALALDEAPHLRFGAAVAASLAALAMVVARRAVMASSTMRGDARAL